jgi:hypothetical protein
MTPEYVQAIVVREIAAWRPPIVEPGETVGIPWTAEQYAPEIERLRNALVTPYKQRFELRETDNPEQRRVTGESEYWVVAATPEMCVWYDEETGDFGVGEPSTQGPLPVSIGLRGDIVGAFCAW